ncbi:DUF484 family protein [Curvibacter sp. CHRR-16]|uniref:DUF484 family protein n=1 Tax=Curvibacter sp. CHRR-16 TaxID=2835872 RepID=UPI001BDA3628|nr:DUF484 family protein [Curvibacter sp. CHRR-16]MBT0569983.1 DUF484 family protein [Curvibacter sp. CHRR-16]
MSQAPTVDVNHPITEDDIANYLVNTPDFFARHAELLATVRFTSPHSHRAVSLQERQAEMLREKIKMLEHRIMDLIRHGNENVILSNKILSWAAHLLSVELPEDMPNVIVNDLKTRFAVPQVGVRLWTLSSAYDQLPCTQGVSEDVQVFAASLTEPFCSLNTGYEAVDWLAEPHSVASLAMVPLCVPDANPASNTFGLLVLASSDAQRFNSGLGTDFLAHIGEIASSALLRLR